MINTRLKPVTTGLIGAVGLGVALLGMPEGAKASNIQAGSDYFISPAGFSTFVFNTDKLNAQLGLGLPPGLELPIALKGLPIGPGATDTIVKRQRDAIFDTDDDGILDVATVTIPIQMVALSLINVAPVNINGFQYNLLATLAPNTPTLGEMTITHQGQVGQPFDDSGTSQGTFTSFLDVHYQVEFTPINGGPAIGNFFDNLLLTQPGQGRDPAPWSHTPPPNALLVRSDGASQSANCHTLTGDCADDDFFPLSLVLHQKGSPGFPNGHGTIITVPEPSTVLGLIAVGLSSIQLKVRVPLLVSLYG